MVNRTYGTGLFSRGFCHFLGIPYAKPPRGSQQFRPPEGVNLQDFPAKFWNLTQRSENCIQYDFENNVLNGSEDCLFLNVYSKPWVSHLQPVVVWIHGGTFNFGSGFSDSADLPDLLINNNITVVTLNYRLGVLGFLYREGERVTRNNGLKDQQEALRWVQKNIANFGGDPTKVTLMGWSAGSAAVSYHLYDSTSEGLFHAAIMMSGSFLNPWAYAPSPETCLYTMCEQMRISCKNQGKLTETLEGLAIEKNQPLLTPITFFGMEFPCFVPSGPYPQMLVKRKPNIDVPLMIGYTSHETEQQIKFNYMESALSNYDFPNPNRFDIIEDFVRTQITEFNRTNLLVAADLIYGMVKFTEEYTSRTKSNTFLYKFSLGDAHHGDDLSLIFRETPYDTNDKIWDTTIKESRNISAKLVQLWSNFIKFQ